MQPDKKTLILPLLLITVGAGWLLSALGVAPSIDWIWTLGLAVVGLLTIAISGIDKFSVVVGPFFCIASGLSILRQSDRLRLELEVPILVIVAGVLLLIARLPAIRVPTWVIPERAPQQPGKVAVTASPDDKISTQNQAVEAIPAAAEMSRSL